ncbi:MAG: NAD-dependent protein deacetylase, SIR2 family [Clostridia bacterium]|nr:NAD-dependent protein deacetylase, SIR2 family [Clostridia bacterium]NCC43037.1 NAD-dependent protein deacetylase, SIR2 family [Clostridia bacterium]
MTQYAEIIKKIKNADAILIGASNGLSITEGLHLFADDQAFQTVFGDLKSKYGLRNILDGYFYRWRTMEEKWGFLSRLIEHYSGSYTPTPVMENLRKIVGEKPYFVVTSNGEGHFEQAGFDADKVYEVEGNWIEMRCSNRCHEAIYPSMEAIHKMAEAEENGIVPSERIPRCPKCGAVMELYNAEPPKKEIINAWNDFLNEFHEKNIVILELGIGWRNQLIKAPLMNLTAREPHAAYITINLGEIYITDNIKEKSYGLDGYLDVILSELAAEYENSEK